MNQSELLQWGILNREQATETTSSTLPTALSLPTEPQPLTPESRPVPEKMDSKWIDIILGRSDVTRMKELLIELDSSDHALTLLALEELEGLVQSIDNANDLGPIGAWPILLKSLTERTYDSVQDRNASIVHILWVIGTALQNNPKAHSQFEQVDGLNVLLQLELDATPCILKLLRCFSALLQHSNQNLNSFYDLKGFEKMIGYCGDESVRGRMFFVLRVLLQAFPIVALMLVQSGFIEALYDYKDAEVAEFLIVVCSVNG
jgi:Nucleotide exchange factor Fes1